MLKKIGKIISILSVTFVVSLIAASVTNAIMYVDRDMSKSFSIVYDGGLKTEYHAGNIIPTDDVSGRAGKSLEAYGGKYNSISVMVKGISGGYDTKSNNHSNKNGDTWFYTSWTDDPNNDDTAEFARYVFNGYTIEFR